MPKLKNKVHSLKGLTSVGPGVAKCPYCGKVGFRAYRDKDGKGLLRCQYCHNAESVRW